MPCNMDCEAHYLVAKVAYLPTCSWPPILTVLGLISVLGSLYLVLCAHQVFPAKFNALNHIGYRAYAASYGPLLVTTAFVLASISRLRCQKNIQIKHEENGAIEGVSDELWLQIFSHAPASDLIQFAKVCKQFYRLSNDEVLWKRLAEAQDLHKEFLTLTERNPSITWKKICLTNCSSFLDRIMQVQFHPNGDTIQYDNPGLSLLSLSPDLAMPQSFTVSDLHRFSICLLNDVKTWKQGEEENFILLSTAETIQLTHLATADKFLFALRWDGVIFQWDFILNEFQKKIDTSYVDAEDENIHNLKKDTWHLQSPRSFCRNFTVTSGYIIVAYKGNLNYWEIISYENPENRKIISSPGTEVLVQDDVFYFCSQRYGIEAWNLEQDTPLFSIPWHQTVEPKYFAIKNNLLCAATWERVFLFDAKSGKKLKDFPFPCYVISHIALSNKALFCYETYSSGFTNMIYVVDLDTGKVSKRIKNAVNFSKKAFNSHVYRELMETA